MHGNQARNARCQTKIPAAISRGIFKIFLSISKCLFSYSAEPWLEKTRVTGQDMSFAAQSYTYKGGHLIRLYIVLLVSASTSEETNTKHVGIVGELAILHEW